MASSLFKLLQNSVPAVELRISSTWERGLDGSRAEIANNKVERECPSTAKYTAAPRNLGKKLVQMEKVEGKLPIQTKKAGACYEGVSCCGKVGLGYNHGGLEET